MFEIENIKARIESLGRKQEWMTNYYLGEGIGTQGKTNKGLKNKKKISLIQSLGLDGKKVLDVGSAEGYFSFYIASEGAEVVGLELDAVRVEKANLVANVIGEQKASFHVRDLSDQDGVGEFGRFDFVFCYAVLHRVTDPINLIISLFEVSDTVVFEWEAPQSFFSDKLSIAFHPVGGSLDARNLITKKAGGFSEHHGDLVKRKPYYQVSPGFVKNVAAECGAVNTKLIHADKRIGFPKKLISWVRFAKNLLTSKKPTSWPLTRRVILVVSRQPFSELQLIDPVYARWDGSHK